MYAVKMGLAIYGLIYLSVLSHELGHFCVAVLLGLKHRRLCIGSTMFWMNTTSIRLSVFPNSGNVELDHEELSKLPMWKIVTLFGAGLVASCMMLIIGWFFFHGIYRLATIVFNAVLMLGSLLPFVKGNDVWQIKTISKERNKTRKKCKDDSV